MKRILFLMLLGVLSISTAFAANTGIVTYTVTPAVQTDAKSINVWLPYPLSDANQDVSDVRVNGNADQTVVYRDPASSAMYLHASWNSATPKPELKMSFHINSHYASLPELKDGKGEFPVEVLPYLNASAQIPCNKEQIQSIAAEATKNRTGTLNKARGVYEWVIANTVRNPDVKGCGLGKALVTLNEAKGGGKCADISAVYVAVARAAGIPTRDVYGLRTSGKDGEITGDFHCWAEFYLPGTGWVAVDPADVRKAMLVNKLELDSPETAKWTEFFWAGDDLFRIALNRDSRGVELTPRQKGETLEYFMYPYAEVDGKPLNFFAPKDFSYTVTFKAD